MRLNAGYLGSPAAHAELPLTPRVKALLQLGLLCHYWQRSAPADTVPREVTSVVEEVWQRPDFPRRLSVDPRHARQFLLTYAALAPAGIAPRQRRTVLSRLDADGYLAPRRKSPYLHLAARFYADLAGVRHRLASYEELYAESSLAGAADLPVAGLDACRITHTVFYLSDFGLGVPRLGEADRQQALRIVERLTDHCVRRGDWDYAAKLVLAQHCLGADPLRTASGAAGLRMLARVQSPDGAIPGKSAAERAAATATPVEFFRKSYQATLVTALTTLVLAGGRPGGRSPAGAATTRETR
jgi:hypothetical protein